MASTIIRLHTITAEDSAPQRLNVFPGRHLGERELDLLQAYADRRLAPLLSGRSPGIVSGLELGVTGTAAQTRLHVRPGSGLGADGRPVRLHYPLDLDWPALVETHERETDAPLRDGLYLVTLRRGAEVIDAGEAGEPCVRTEPDPLRDTRLETVARLGLQLVTANPRWLTMPASRTANRVCVRHLAAPPFDPATGAIPLALVRVASGAPTWFDGPAGRIEARPDGPYRALLAHAQSIMAGFNRRLAPLLRPSPRILQPRLLGVDTLAPLARQPELAPLSPVRLADTVTTPPIRPLEEGPGGLAGRLGLDYLPAAGPLPRALIEDLGGSAPQLAFEPLDLQVELTAAPARTVPAVIERELTRGVVDLVHHQHDRIRVLVAVEDADYRPDLMNLPQIDAELEADLYWRGKAAFEAHGAWKSQWQSLFLGLDAQALGRAQAPEMVASPPLADAYLTGLVDQRRAALGESDAPLPEPYVSHEANPNPPPDGYEALGFTDLTEPGLYQRREDLIAAIKALEDELEENFSLLGALNDGLTLQRQQLDAISVSFTALAGGSPGDGSGLGLMKVANYAFLKPQTTQPEG